MPLFGGNKKKQETFSRPERPVVRPEFRAVEPRIERINWLGLKVFDSLDEALFLEEKLHLKFLNEGNSTAGHHILFDCETLQLELVGGGPTWASRAKPRQGSPDVPLVASFVVDNLEEIARQLAEDEVLATRIFDQGWVASLLFFDVERNLWQISEIRNEPAVNLNYLRRIGAVWLAAEDLLSQVAFYRDVLGLPLSDLGNRPRPITENAERHQQSEEPEPPEETVVEQAVPETMADATDSTGEEAKPYPDCPAKEIREGATFFESGARLVLTEGGHRLENGGEKQWGHDSPFMLGFQTNDLAGMAEKLRQAGVRLSDPQAFRRSASYNHPTRSFRFTDPEGNVWQISE